MEPVIELANRSMSTILVRTESSSGSDPTRLLISAIIESWIGEIIVTMRK
jgi:hypothetical protein